MRRRYFYGKATLITGASSGIGEELALQLGQAGARLTLAARRPSVLERLADRVASLGAPRPLVVTCDVTRDGDVERAVAESVRQWGELSIAIANAGFGVVGPFTDLSLDDYRRQFETNVFGVLRTAYAAIPELEKTRGHLVLMGSVAGWTATPGISAYAMSKFAVRALANAITPELRLAGVRVTLISPGFVVSNIRRVDNRGTLHAGASDQLPAWLPMPTGKAVGQMLDAMAQGKGEVIITGHGKVLVALERFAPWAMRAFGRLVARSRGYRSEIRP
jgi:short-subunit dehydrogenase